MFNIIHPNKNLVNGNSPKIAFLGTPEFAVPILEKLINSEYKPAAVFCAPDMPVGRRQVLTPPPAKITAQKYGIPVYQPEDKNGLLKQLSALNCDLVISAAFGMILPKAALELPRFDCLNIHPSLLPKYRGASPIQTAILNGDAKTGVTIYKMDEQIDHGTIIAQKKIALSSVVASATPQLRGGAKQSRDTAAVHGIAASPTAPRNDIPTTPELSQKLSNLGADLLLKILPDWLAGKITPTPQDNSQATFTKIITKEDGQIDWQKPAKEIEQQIRAYTPWPGSYTSYSSSESERVKKSKLKIIDADATEKNYGKQTGEIFLADTNDLAIQTGDGALIIKKLQLEGGKPLSAQDFLRGHKNIIGQILK